MLREFGLAFGLTAISVLGGCSSGETTSPAPVPTEDVQSSNESDSSVTKPCEPVVVETDKTMTLTHEETTPGHKSCTYDTKEIDAEKECRDTGTPFETTAINGIIKEDRSQENTQGLVRFQRTIYCSGPSGVFELTHSTTVEESPFGTARVVSEEVTKP